MCWWFHFNFKFAFGSEDRSIQSTDVQFLELGAKHWNNITGRFRTRSAGRFRILCSFYTQQLSQMKVSLIAMWNQSFRHSSVPFHFLTCLIVLCWPMCTCTTDHPDALSCDVSAWWCICQFHGSSSFCSHFCELAVRFPFPIPVSFKCTTRRCTMQIHSDIVNYF